jgi:hypothetical protein
MAVNRGGRVMAWMAAAALLLGGTRPAPAANGTSAPSKAAPATRAFDDLKIGMKGVGKTVFHGEAIEDFDFEIVDLMRSSGFNHDLILIRVSGPKVDAIGGIAYGMSGSPLYVDGAMIGAVAMTTKGTDAHYGYATPIADMIKLFDAPPATTVGPTDREQASALDLLPAGTPVHVSGLSGRALVPLARLLARRGLQLVGEPAATKPPTPAAPGAGEDPAAAVVPGSALSCALTTGDVSVEATGTVTWRDGNRVLAFGHSFLHQGPSAFLLERAYIAAVLPSHDMPTKVGFPITGPIGAITMDRDAGIAGMLGQDVPTCDVSVHVRDADQKRERTLSVKVVRDPDLTPVLVASSLQQALDEVMDRSGGGGAHLLWKIEGDGLDGTLNREDVLYSSSDVQSEAVAGPLFALDALLHNDFHAVVPRRIQIDVATTTERRTARLVSLKVTPAKVHAGESVTVTARLQGYRGAGLTRELLVNVPAGAAPGRLLVEAHGRVAGASGPMSQAALLAAGMAVPTSLPELLHTLSSGQRGDALWVELLTPEASEAREQAAQQLATLPTADPFDEETLSMPALDLPSGAGAAPLALAEARVEPVVLGRLRDSVTVVAGP